MYLTPRANRGSQRKKRTGVRKEKKRTGVRSGGFQSKVAYPLPYHSHNSPAIQQTRPAAAANFNMMSMARITCTFCGSIPDSFNEAGQSVCYRHKNSYDMSLDLAGGTNGKRKADNSGKNEEEEEEEHDDFAVPHLAGGKGKEKKKQRVARVTQKECMICMGKFRTAGTSCGAGTHHSCKGCTRMYIEKTLGSKGTVYFDRVPCMDPGCWSLIPAREAEGVLTKKKLAEMEKKQFDLAYLLSGEVDPSSQALLNDKTKPCPNCKSPIEKAGGCSHMTCSVCSHEFWWGCPQTCKYPFHSENCSEMYPTAPLANE